MSAFVALVRSGLVLALRNRMAMIYGFVFPLVFLAAFAVLYRHEPVPVALHLGQLLTVTILGGACFGLPTTIVGERERGVWQRYRLAPVSPATLVASVLVVRLGLLLAAALVQIAVAMAIGMHSPAHPGDLLIGFVIASFAFLALGMVVAMAANSVPAVQALGQCIFLPMLIIGGVAVPLSTLPEWTQQVSAYLPGVHAVAVQQAATTGDGLRSGVSASVALLGMGAASAVLATCLFRWDAHERVSLRSIAPWFAVALGIWVVAAMPVARPMAIVTDAGEGSVITTVPRRAAPPTLPPTRPVPTSRSAVAPPRVPPSRPLPPPLPAAPAITPAEAWRRVTPAEIADVAFDRLPPDTGLVAPIAAPGAEPSAIVAAQLQDVRARLDRWPSGRVADPVQRVRNLLAIAAVPDVLRMDEVERHLPLIVFAQLQREFAPDDLRKLLYWVAMHPEEGSDTGMRALAALGLPAVTGPTREARPRVMIYALKLLGRLTSEPGIQR